MKKIALFTLISIVVFLGINCETWAQSDKYKDHPLQKYYSPAYISILDWEIMQVNLLWINSFDPSIDYIEEYPISFDAKHQQIVVNLRVQDKRFFNDNEPFFNLPKQIQNAVLMKPVLHVKELLSPSFPEIKTMHKLLLVQFWHKQTREGVSTIFANYQNGELKWMQ